MGVEVRYTLDDDEQRYLDTMNAGALTRFYSNSPDETLVLLSGSANDAAVFEEYLHILEGQARGWLAVDSTRDALIEEIRVGQQTFAHVDELGATIIERVELQRTLQAYRVRLRDYFGIDPDVL